MAMAAVIPDRVPVCLPFASIAPVVLASAALLAADVPYSGPCRGFAGDRNGPRTDAVLGP